ncbi:MAG: FHA domain-containing protein [Planctomycetes bacterium]|nr:FHA domain-containing protein [Planctomycetota bacterium]
MPFIRVRTGPHQGKVFEIKDDVITIGRDENQMIQILDQGVSRMHAEIFKLGGICFVRDLNSTNGTFVNSVRITEEALKENDELLIGRTILRYEEKLRPDTSIGFIQIADPTTRLQLQPLLTKLGKSAPTLPSQEVRSRSITLAHELGKILIGAEDFNEALAKTLKLVAENVGADDGYFFMNERSTGRLIQRASYEREEDRNERKVSKTIAKRILQTGMPLLTSDAALDQRLNISESVVLKKIKAVIAVPIMLRDRAEGLLYFHTSRTSAPFSLEDLEVVISAALQVSLALTEHVANKRLRDRWVSTVRALVTAMEARLPRKHGHSDRVAQYSVAVAGQLGLGRQEIEHIRLAALMHDIGRIHDPPGEAAPESHVYAGERILQGIEGYEDLLPGVRYHHERADGSGFPYGIRNEETPLMARIIIVTNHFDDLGMSSGAGGADPTGKEALAKISEGGGKIFDEDVVKGLIICHNTGALYDRPVES